MRLLRIKRLSSLGFSLSRISEVLDEMDAHLAEAAGPNADEALDELDRELALQIERLQEQRRTIALLKREQLDPDLPVRFARAAKTLFAAEHFNDGERQAIAHHGGTSMTKGSRRARASDCSTSARRDSSIRYGLSKRVTTNCAPMQRRRT